MSDNGPPFLSNEFAAFASQYGFDHITSSPRYQQSNDFIERMVQTVKQSMTKCAAAGHDLNLAMLIDRATPLTASILSPAELLNRRKYRALLPTRSPIQNPHCQIVQKQMIEDKYKRSEHYKKTARDLPSLPQHQRVYIKVDPQCNRWAPATVTNCKTPVVSQPRSYSVETKDGIQLVRNRRFIHPAQETAPLTTKPNVCSMTTAVAVNDQDVISKAESYRDNLTIFNKELKLLSIKREMLHNQLLQPRLMSLT